MNYNPLLNLDWYKITHQAQHSPELAYMVSYYTPRITRLKGVYSVVNFGLQYFCKHYLIDTFNKYFFSRPEEEVVAEYSRIVDAGLGKGTYDIENIRKLHQLGYLPLELAEIPEGTRVPIKVPMIQIKNTHPDFAWLTNTIESLMSTTLWHMQVAATVGYEYRQIVNKWYEETVDETCVSQRALDETDDSQAKTKVSAQARALGDFSYRGQHSHESACSSSAAFCLSFVNTATVPAIMWLEDYYNCDCAKEPVAYGAISTEHSVMCSNYAIDGDEKTFVKRLLEEIYPNNNFSMVSDSYDYWNMVTNILPSLRNEIMAHNGTLLVRGDSGDPVDIICGKEYMTYKYMYQLEEAIECFPRYQHQTVCVGLKYYDVFVGDRGYLIQQIEVSPAEKGTVQLLWELFGGTINKKGYKVLDKHVKAIYGDSITQRRAKEIYRRLKKKGFSAENVVLGVGSFSFMCKEEFALSGNAVYQPYTRDTFGIAVKATYGELRDGTPIEIFKNPKTDTGAFKKSQKGLCHVYMDETNGEITYTDGYNSASLPAEGNLLEPIFRDGKMIKEYSLAEIRDRLHDNKF